MRINLPVSVNRPERMTLGDIIYISGGDFSIGKNSTISIGCNCLISYRVHFRTFSHNYINKNKLILIKENLKKIKKSRMMFG